MGSKTSKRGQEDYQGEQFLLDTRYLTDYSYLSLERRWNVISNNNEIVFFCNALSKRVKGSTKPFHKNNSYTVFRSCTIPKQNYIRLFPNYTTNTLIKEFRIDKNSVIKQVVSNLQSILFADDDRLSSHGNLENALFLGENGIVYTNVYDGGTKSFKKDIRDVAKLVQVLDRKDISKSLKAILSLSVIQDYEIALFAILKSI